MHVCWAPKFSAFSSKGPFKIFLGSSLGAYVNARGFTSFACCISVVWRSSKPDTPFGTLLRIWCVGHVCLLFVLFILLHFKISTSGLKLTANPCVKCHISSTKCFIKNMLFLFIFAIMVQQSCQQTILKQTLTLFLASLYQNYHNLILAWLSKCHRHFHLAVKHETQGLLPLLIFIFLLLTGW